MTIDWCAFASLLVGLAVFAWVWQRRQQPPRHPDAVIARVQRLLKPRTPDDCLACRQPMGVAGTPLARPSVTPWRERKSRRGAPKRINTHGFACPKRTCAYYQISDAQIHALVGDGIDGKAERIQTFRCQACGATFSARRGTPLYHLKTTSHRVAEVLTALAEGLSVSAAVRVFGHRHVTITTWLTRAGEHTATLHDRIFRNLRLPHIQLDEIRTRLRKRVHGLWLWLAIDPISKLIPVLHHPEGTRGANPGCSPYSRPRAAPALGPGLPPGLHQRRLESVFLCAHGPLRSVGRRRWATSTSLAGGGRAPLWTSEEALSPPAADRCDVCATLWDAHGAAGGLAGAGPEWTAEYGVRRAPQEGRSGKAWRPSSAAPGRPCRTRRSCCSTWNGGGRIIISCARTRRSGWRWRSHVSAAASASPSGIGSAPQRWRPG